MTAGGTAGCRAWLLARRLPGWELRRAGSGSREGRRSSYASQMK